MSSRAAISGGKRRGEDLGQAARDRQHAAEQHHAARTTRVGAASGQRAGDHGGGGGDRDRHPDRPGRAADHGRQHLDRRAQREIPARDGERETEDGSDHGAMVPIGIINPQWT